MSRQWTTLVQPEELAADLDADDLVILDCRCALMDPGAGRRDYDASHIPGARHADLNADLSDLRKQGQGRHPWPDVDDFLSRLSAWGISPATRVVAYDAGDGAFAARAWCLLHLLGHAEVAVLDGGWVRWQVMGLPSDAETPARPAPAHYAGEFERSRLLDAPAVQAHVASGGLLVDVRGAERFRGEVEPIDPVAGHVPGACNRPYVQNLEDGRFKPTSRLREEFEALLAGRTPGELVAMCGSGVTACHHLLAMEHAGLPGAKLFSGSWSGWISDPSRPVARGV